MMKNNPEDSEQQNVLKDRKNKLERVHDVY
jgi:hypothetical protein